MTKKDNILKFIGSTYNGALDFSDYYLDIFKENGYSENQVSEAEADTFEEFKKELSREADVNLKVSDYSKGLKKYGIEITEAEFITPKAYNYSNDSLRICFHYKQKNILKFALDNKELFEKYFKEEMIKSCDGYISQEPDNYQELIRCIKGTNRFNWNYFYSIFWAIEQKENLEKKWKDFVYMMIDNASEIYYDLMIGKLNENKVGVK